MATRRDFIKRGSLATLVGATLGSMGSTNAFGLGHFYKIPFESKKSSIYSFTETRMRGFINTVFDVRSQNGNSFASLKLIEVSNSRVNRKTNRQLNSNSFSMLLKGLKGAKLEQGTYDFNHEKLGTFSVFLVPVTSNDNYYEVIFNNLRD